MSMTLSKAIATMKYVNSKGNPVPFDIEFVTCDLNRGTGGEWRRIDNAVKCKSPMRHDLLDIITVRASNNESRAVNVHLCLIMMINGERVT